MKTDALEQVCCGYNNLWSSKLNYAEKVKSVKDYDSQAEVHDCLWFLLQISGCLKWKQKNSFIHASRTQMNHQGTTCMQAGHQVIFRGLHVQAKSLCRCSQAFRLKSGRKLGEHT